MRIFVLEAPLSVLALDLHMRFVAASPAVLKNAGRTMDQIQGLTVGELIPGAEGGMREIAEALAAGKAKHSVDRPARMPDGKLRWYETQGSYWRDDAGEVAGYLIINQEVTAEREAEAGRHEMEALLKAVIDNIPATLSVQDLETERFLLVNTRTSEALGLAPADVVGKHLSDITTAEQASRVSRQVASLRETGAANVSEQFVMQGALGGRTLRLKKLLFEDGTGRKRILSIGEDVTDLREANQALEVAVAEAEAANAAKSRFLANISHEIRTPLNGVLGMAQAMARDPLPRRQRERLDVIRKSGETLLSLLNDLLDLSKIEAGKIELESMAFDLSELVRTACAPFRTLAENKGVALEVRLDAERDLRRGDPTRLRQVLVNLVSNAVKFTEQGRIEVAVSEEGEQVRFVVSDTGLGMAPETVETMFEKFAQGDASTTRRFGGTGLGLAICRELVALMDGRIEVQSAPGQGSRFSLLLPLPRAAELVGAAADPPPPARGPLPPLRLLAAEDNRINQLVLTTLLEQVGISLSVVDDGAQALAAWEVGAWDVILMDVQMPVMDGLAATAAIRAREAAEGRTRTPIIALTANAMAHHAAEYQAGGMDAVVSKPIQLEAVLGALESVLTPQDEAERSPGAQPLRAS